MSSNPAPRPALRKAPDATVHPAAPVLAAGSHPPVVDPHVDAPDAPLSRPAHLRPVVGLGGSTSDALRKAPPKKKVAESKDAKKLRKMSKKERKRHSRRVKLQVEVPKGVRTRLRSNAKARGTSVDDVVTSVLEGWLDG
ncbi:MAG: hypothetical protein QG597_300 [Actinomycetota bacterium]|nr:hypothetical protein [Actinomycetota bacterium]